MSAAPDKPRFVVGVMTGTSIDGLDASLVEIRGWGLDISATLVAHHARALGALAPRLRAAAAQEPLTAGELARLAHDFGLIHAGAIEELLTSPAARKMARNLSLICVHGQTIFHQPPVSWQLINPAPIASRFDCPVVFDLRQADLAAGGQGAPITPLADWILFRHDSCRRAIVNLGGFCNVTILPAARERNARPARFEAIDQVRGFDVCACNQILDAVARAALGVAFDDHGAAAVQGRCDKHACDSLLAILRHQRSGNRSLGTGDEAEQWVQDHVQRLAANDLACSAARAIGRCISDALAEHGVEEIIAAGGGARHEFLVRVIREQSGLPVRRSDDLGVPIEARESMAMAVLGSLCADGVTITLPQVTGCTSPPPLSGTWMFPSRAASLRGASAESRTLAVRGDE